MRAALAGVDAAIAEIAARWREARSERQARRHLVTEDFDLLREAGLLRAIVPVEAGGLWHGPAVSARPLCGLYRRLAAADPSVALVSSMHPAVVAFWLCSPDSSQPAWEDQRRAVFASAAAGDQWGTITSEPADERPARHGTVGAGTAPGAARRQVPPRGTGRVS